MSKKIKILTTGLLIIASLGAALFFYNKYQNLKKTISDPAIVAKSEVKDLVAKIGKLIELPGDELPTVATVSDKEKLKAQPFFAKVQNGDKVLIYTKAKKAILYRPSTNRIVEVGPVNIGEALSPSPPQTTASARIASPTQQPASFRVAIYNASKTAGLAASTEARLKTKFNNVLVVEKGNSQGDYEKNLVVDLSGSQKKLASDIADFLGGEVGSFPLSELKPDSDVLIIVIE